MAVSFFAVNNQFGEAGAVTTPAADCGVAATLPPGTANGDRVLVLQSHSGVSAASPANWTALYKDRVIGSGAVAAGSGQRWMSCHYRDYNGVWTMPATWPLVSSTNIDQAIGVITLRKGAAETWDTPTASAKGEDFGTADTTYLITTASAFTTIVNAFLIAHTVLNDGGNFLYEPNVTGTNGFVGSATTDRVQADAGNTQGVMHTLSVTTAASPAGTLTADSATTIATQGGTTFIQQTVSAPPGSSSDFFYGRR